MRLILALSYCILSLGLVGQETFPDNGASDKELVMQAFTHCTLHLDWQTTLTDATLLIHKGKVIAAGTDVEIPKGTAVSDLNGMHVYPSFIDLNSNYGLPKVDRAKWKPQPQYESNTKGAYGWNESVKPEFHASEIIVHDAAKAADMRSKGFGAVLSHRPDGVVRGTSALIGLGSNENHNLILSQAAANYSFRKGSSRQKYPYSLMGAIALLRQTYYDADWYASEHNERETNLSLEAFNEQLGLVQVFDAGDKWDILRADKICDEFNFQYVFLGNGDEYQRIDDIKSTTGAVVVPVDFPAAYDVSDPYLTRMVSLTEMMHWDQAPANLASLQQAEIPFAVTAEGTKDAGQFFSNIRKAVDAGLDKNELLRALTETPASLLNISEQTGSLDAGKLANFLVCSDDIFAKDCVIYENWVQGEVFVIADKDALDLAGSYHLTIDGTLYNMKVKGANTKYKGTIELIEGSDTTTVAVKIQNDGDRLNMQLQPEEEEGLLRLAGNVHMASRIWDGKGQAPNGEWFEWVAVRQDAESAETKDGSAETTAENDSTSWSNPVIYPFMAYGQPSLPEAETLLIKNATIWTCEDEGIIEKGELLIRDGKIAAVGQRIDVAALFPKEDVKPTVIDAKGKHVTPGIIDEHSHIAVTRGVNEGTQASSAEVQIAHSLNPEDINIYRQLSGGVTCSQLLHGSANPIGGQSALIKLRWGVSADELLVEDAAPFIKFALGENVKQSNWGDFETVRFPQTRMGVEQVYYDLFIQAAEYDRAWEVYKDSLLKLTRRQKRNGEYPDMPRRDLELETLSQILKGERFITCHSYRQDEINMLMHVADSMGFTLNTFTHILEGYKVADKMKAHGAGASTFSDWWAYKYEVKDAIPYNGALLHDQGIVTAFNSDDAEMARRLNQEAGKAVMYGGVSEEEALKFVTLNPAKLLHVDDQMGSLKVGKDADVVIWSDNPLSIYAVAEQTYVDGKCYYSKEKDAGMRQMIKEERARIIQLMSDEKGSEKRAPKAKQIRHYHCDSEFDELND